MKPDIAALTIHAEVGAGEHIVEAMREALRVATILQVNVEFKFNDRTITAFPDDDLLTLAKRYRQKEENENG